MADLFLGGEFAPAGLSVSFLRAPVEDVALELVRMRDAVEVSEAALATATQRLEPFQAPWTRELVFDCGEWTAYLNNGIDGGDPTAVAPAVARHLAVDLVVAVHSRRHLPGHASTQLWVLGPDGDPPLMFRRTVAASCVDGRWNWHESGRPLAFEDTDRYLARRIRDRFDRGALVSHLAAFGIRVDDPGFYGRGRLVQQLVDFEPRSETTAEVLARFGW